MQEQEKQPQGIRRVHSEENLRNIRKLEDQSQQQSRGKRRRRSETDVQSLKKRVRIQVEPVQVVEPLPLPRDMCCWYSREELVYARKYARKLSRLANSDSVLNDTFGKACELTVTIGHATSGEVDKHFLSDGSTLGEDPAEQEHSNQEQIIYKKNVVKNLARSGAFWKQRGLERLSRQHAISRSMQVCSVKSAVLLEQTSQYLDGVQDPERLARASRMASQPSQHFAQMLAMADQAMAKKIHLESATTTSKNTVAPTA